MNTDGCGMFAKTAQNVYRGASIRVGAIHTSIESNETTGFVAFL